MTTANPVLAEVTRGHSVESRHRGAYVIADSHGGLIESAGDIARPVFPRSSVKAFQCVPVIESGAADRFGFTDEEIALCCASHNGEAEHVRVAASMFGSQSACRVGRSPMATDASTSMLSRSILSISQFDQHICMARSPRRTPTGEILTSQFRESIQQFCKLLFLAVTVAGIVS
jgi:L-asparaginase II